MNRINAEHRFGLLSFSIQLCFYLHLVLCQEECKNGTYGATCSMNCNPNCGHDKKCDRTTGACLNGCDDGKMCNEVTAGAVNITKGKQKDYRDVIGGDAPLGTVATGIILGVAGICSGLLALVAVLVMRRQKTPEDEDDENGPSIWDEGKLDTQEGKDAEAVHAHEAHEAHAEEVIVHVAETEKSHSNESHHSGHQEEGV